VEELLTWLIGCFSLFERGTYSVSLDITRRRNRDRNTPGPPPFFDPVLALALGECRDRAVADADGLWICLCLCLFPVLTLSPVFQTCFVHARLCHLLRRSTCISLTSACRRQYTVHARLCHLNTTTPPLPPRYSPRTPTRPPPS